MPKISVIIPCYNLGEYLGEAVVSVLAQTRRDFEIIVVDDGSTEERTKMALAELDQPEVRVVRIENRGLPAARNYGIERATGEYICCLDADDRYEPAFLEKTAARLDQDREKRLGLVTTWLREFGERQGLGKTEHFDIGRLLNYNVIHVASLFRRECWEKVGGYDTTLAGYQDWNFWIAIVSRGYRWAVVEEPLFLYRVRPESMVVGSDRRRGELLARIISNHRDYYLEHVEDILQASDRRHQAQVALVTELGRRVAVLERRSRRLLATGKIERRQRRGIIASRSWRLAQLLREAARRPYLLPLLPLRALGLWREPRARVRREGGGE